MSNPEYNQYYTQVRNTINSVSNNLSSQEDIETAQWNLAVDGTAEVATTATLNISSAALRRALTHQLLVITTTAATSIIVDAAAVGSASSAVFLSALGLSHVEDTAILHIVRETDTTAAVSLRAHTLVEIIAAGATTATLLVTAVNVTSGTEQVSVVPVNLGDIFVESIDIAGGTVLEIFEQDAAYDPLPAVPTDANLSTIVLVEGFAQRVNQYVTAYFQLTATTDAAVPTATNIVDLLLPYATAVDTVISGRVTYHPAADTNGDNLDIGIVFITAASTTEFTIAFMATNAAAGVIDCQLQYYIVDP